MRLPIDEGRMAVMFDRISTDPAILAGKAVIKGTRISVEFLLELAASGASRADIINRYPQLTNEDVEQAFLFAGKSVARDEFMSIPVVH